MTNKERFLKELTAYYTEQQVFGERKSMESPEVRALRIFERLKRGDEISHSGVWDTCRALNISATFYGLFSYLQSDIEYERIQEIQSNNIEN